MYLPSIDRYQQTGQRPALEALINRVWCMDSLQLMAMLPDDSIDLIVTSPPYDNLRDYNGYSFDFEAIARESYRVLKTGGVLVWVVGDSVVNGSETLTSMRQALYFVDAVGFRMHDTMIWQKTGSPFPSKTRYFQVFEFCFVMSKGKPNTANLQRQLATGHGGGKLGSRNKKGNFVPMQYKRGFKTRVMDNVWKIKQCGPSDDRYSRNHPAVFPEQLAKRHILTWSNPGDIVLDYFMGSGTTAKMARNNGRRYIGCDISAEYCKIARDRLATPYTPSLFESVEKEQPKAEQVSMFSS